MPPELIQRPIGCTSICEHVRAVDPAVPADAVSQILAEERTAGLTDLTPAVRKIAATVRDAAAARRIQAGMPQ